MGEVLCVGKNTIDAMEEYIWRNLEKKEILGIF